MRPGRFILGMSIVVCAHAATAADLLGRYGSPEMQRYAAGNGIAVSVEYNEHGGIAPVEIAPVGYQRREPGTNLSMDRGDTSALIDFFVPRERQQQMQMGLNCLSSMNRETGTPDRSSSCGTGQGDQDITIHRTYTKAGDTEREVVATITSKSGLPQTVITLETRFGAPVAERFAAKPGIALTATYGTARAVTEIAIAPMRRLLDASDEAQFMPALDVESILDEIAPPWTRTGTLKGGSIQSGCNQVLIEEFEKLSITRSFHHCRLPAEGVVMQAGVRWGPRPMTAESGKK